jgi:peptide/nickel transport system substrate-binding protein
MKNKGPAKIDKIVYREIKDESTRFLELETGKLDVLFAVPTMFSVRNPGPKEWHQNEND